MKLYHCPATRSARVKWLLHELLDDDFDCEVVPLYDGAQYSEDYLQMLHFGTSWTDIMLWQIRIHTHVLGGESDARTVARYNRKFTEEVEPQLTSRLQRGGYVCGDTFSAVDCVMGQNVLWAKAYGLCRGQQFSDYVSRLSQRTAFAKAYADIGEFTLAPPPGKGRGLADKFTG